MVGEPSSTAEKINRLIGKENAIFFNGHYLVRVAAQDDNMPRAIPVTVDYVRRLAHKLCCPIRLNKKGEKVSAIINDDVAGFFLNSMEGDWNVEVFRGITTTPILVDDGSIRFATGFDVESGLWAHNIPQVTVPWVPTEDEARTALAKLRFTFRTFPFEDAEMVREGAISVVDQTKPPGLDESVYLAGVLTAVCRPSLPFAPALLINAPMFSGAGAGKGLLVAAACILGSGAKPTAFNGSNNAEELEKRLVTGLQEANPALFLDNCNGKSLESETLASALTQDPMMVRVLGHSKNVKLFTTVFIGITGNSLVVSEDLARRIIGVNLDPRMDNPEKREFEGSFLEDILARRTELVTAALTIWRWGRQQKLRAGPRLGNYEVWCQWVRDPLLALGCKEPVDRITENKKNDPRRREIELILDMWEDKHGVNTVKGVTAGEVDVAVMALISPGDPSRNTAAAWLRRHKGSRVSGYWLEEHPPATKRVGPSYILRSNRKTGSLVDQ